MRCVYMISLCTVCFSASTTIQRLPSCGWVMWHQPCHMTPITWPGCYNATWWLLLNPVEKDHPCSPLLVLCLSWPRSNLPCFTYMYVVPCAVSVLCTCNHIWAEGMPFMCFYSFVNFAKSPTDMQTGVTLSRCPIVDPEVTTEPPYVPPLLPITPGPGGPGTLPGWTHILDVCQQVALLDCWHQGEPWCFTVVHSHWYSITDLSPVDLYCHWCCTFSVALITHWILLYTGDFNTDSFVCTAHNLSLHLKLGILISNRFLLYMNTEARMLFIIDPLLFIAFICSMVML